MDIGKECILAITDSLGLKAIVRHDPISRKRVFYKVEEMGDEEIIALFQDQNK